MKNIFPGYYKKSDEDLKRIWDNGIILFDTNVLLNLYRYSDTTRETIIDLIKKLSKKIALPHQSALEYNRNRYEVIAEQEKAYKEFLDKIAQIQKDLQSTSKPPFLSKKIDTELNSVFKDVRNEVEENIKKYCDFLMEDPIFEDLTDIFNEKISDAFTSEELEEIYKEGEIRYKSKTPPGFEDEKNKEGVRKFGDLILWKQVLQIACKQKKDIILITDERKIDWWWKIKDGRNMGPRQELVEEIKLNAGVDFHMYSSERFISYGQTYLKQKIDQKAIKEIQAMKQAELESIKELEKINFIRRKKISNLNVDLRTKIESLDNEIDLLSEHIDSLRNNKEFDFENADLAKFHIDQLASKRNELQSDRKNLMSEYRFNKERMFKYKSMEDEKYFKFKNRDNDKQ